MQGPGPMNDLQWQARDLPRGSKCSVVCYGGGGCSRHSRTASRILATHQYHPLAVRATGDTEDDDVLCVAGEGTRPRMLPRYEGRGQTCMACEGRKEKCQWKG